MSNFAIRAGASRRSDTLVRFAVVVGLAIIGIPQAITKYPWGLPIPIQNAGAVLIILTACVLFFQKTFSRKLNSSSGLTWVLLSVLLYVTVVGLFHHNATNFLFYFFFRELLYLAMCLGGVMLALSCPISLLVTVAEDICIGGSILLLMSSIGLKLGLLGQVDEASGRLLDISLYVYSYGIMASLPVIARNSTATNRRIAWIITLAVTSLSFFGLISATRSTFLQAAVSLLLSGILLVRKRHWRVQALLWATLALFSIAAALLKFTDVSIIRQRVDSTALTEETRFIEMQELFTDYKEWFPMGSGIGVGFQTIVTEDSDDRFGGLINAPHLGIFAWSIKAGVWGSILTLCFLAAAMRALLEPSSKLQVTTNFYLGLAVLLSIGSTSGGWTMFELFLTGLFIGAGSRPLVNRLRSGFN